MHASMATPGLAANHHTGNGQDYLRIVEHPDAHNSSLPDAQVVIHFHA